MYTKGKGYFLVFCAGPAGHLSGPVSMEGSAGLRAGPVSVEGRMPSGSLYIH